MSKHAPESAWDRRRFRPNALVETAAGCEGLVEAEWGGGRRIRIGEVELSGEMPTVRCVMITLPQGDLAQDPRVLRTVVREGGQSIGLYASIAATGRIRVGDPVELV